MTIMTKQFQVVSKKRLNQSAYLILRMKTFHPKKKMFIIIIKWKWRVVAITTVSTKTTEIIIANAQWLADSFWCFNSLLLKAIFSTWLQPNQQSIFFLSLSVVFPFNAFVWFTFSTLHISNCFLLLLMS